MEPGPSEAELARIAGLTEAIADPDGDGEPGVPTGSELNHSKRPSADTTYGRNGMLTVDSDRLGMNDVTILNTEEFNASSESRLSIGTLKSSVYSRVKDNKTDVLTVYSDVADAKPQAWDLFYTVGAIDVGGVNVTAAAPTGDAPPTGTTRYNTIEIAAGSIPTALANRISGISIGRSLASGNNNAINGTFHNVSGKYTCSATCTLNAASNGAITLAGGNLTFTPNNTKDDTQDIHMISGALPDTDYQSFGYWVQTTPMGSDMKYGVGTFAGGNMPYTSATDGTFTSTDLDSLDGTATYEGSATGLYARKDLEVADGKVTGTPVETGQFSADVVLTAHFGSTSGTGPHVNKSNEISDRDQFTISGTVSNFHNANGRISDWGLTLNRAHLRDGNADNTSYDGTFGATTGSGDTAGEWQGRLFGPVADTAATPPRPATTTYPSGVTGEFTGHFQDGHVIGAFGTTRD